MGGFWLCSGCDDGEREWVEVVVMVTGLCDSGSERLWWFS